MIDHKRRKLVDDISSSSESKGWRDSYVLLRFSTAPCIFGKVSQFV